MVINAPISVINPPPVQDLFVVRGDRFEMNIGFTELPDAATIAVQQRLTLVIRRRQSDTLNNLISTDATFELNTGDTINGVPIDLMATFVIDAVTTPGIPVQGAVYYIEWTDLGGGEPSRVVQGRVRVGD